ncbi:MAG: inner membrane protein YpjD [Nitrospiria bacterium]
MLNVLFFNATLFFYFLGTALFLVTLWLDQGKKRESTNRLSGFLKLAVIVTAAGFICHTAALAIRLKEGGYIPLTNLHEAVSFFSWAIVLIFFWVEFKTHLYILGSFILPLAFLSLISASALPDDIPEISPAIINALLGIHTTLSVLGIVAFTIAFIAGIMYLLQEKFLKSKQLNALYDRLPALDMLDQWNKKAILFGFPLLTLGIISGALWAQYALGSFWGDNNSKQALAVGIWFFYLLVLHGRITVGWRAKKAARLAIIGFVGVIFIFFTLA